MRLPPNPTWTSVRKRMGYRHFQVKCYGGKGTERWVELYPLIRKEILVRVLVSELNDHSEWTSGWLQLKEGEDCGCETT